MGAIRQKRNHRTDNMLEKPLKRALRRLGTSTGHLKSMCATDLLHMDTGARPRSDNEAAHLRLYHRILSKDGAVTRKVMESLPADHPWMRRVHNAGAVVCPHAPTADLSKAAA
jgi:hypothetical protein